MKTKRALEITIETHESTTIHIREHQPESLFCGFCRSETVHLTFSVAASSFELPLAIIVDLAKTGRIHFAGGKSGEPLICINSFPTKSL